MKKILIVVPDLSIVGGRERVVANLSNELVKNYKIYITSIFNANKNIVFNYSKNIELIKLSDIKEITLSNVKNPFFKILRELARPLVRFANRIIIKIMSRRFIKLAKKIEPDIIIDNSDSFINGKFAVKNSAVIKLIHGKFDIYKNFNLDGLQNFVLLSSQELDKFKTKYPNSNFYIIPNFIPNISNLNTNYSQKLVVSVGRLSKEKGFLRLIDIWKLIQDNKEFKDWKLHIVGDGDLKEQIKTKIDNLNLSNSIILKPFTKDVESEYLSASIYAMASHFEGLPMVLIEAGTYALPTIAFDIATGPSDIIEDEKSGFLIEDNNLDEYANKLKILMQDESLRAKMGEKSKEIVKNKFSKEVVMKQWENLFKRLKSDK
ncbi:glycosyltransferase, family 1 [Campylobacter lanienae NCTC 13004]|uniref:Glycosyltransferase, family 1 n=1 Tax=Campylobacter lanienae NCTC 13004 TaxID=1031753 RepID=A0A1X9SP32_9BACT|nr:glycosyltransferase family 4 protein [Campylobacter lanienae]ARQ97992.1 glycosyltransferase, family 1 [Campylobacter lanienae NCTC 13004]